ncbi:MAG: VOC family protein [Verrucomicrobia bacterium]|nr:VOC family protein [Verrucomicrobiota bacterium]
MENGQDNMNPAKGRLHHLAIQTRDWEESKRFYIDILGMEQVGGFQLPHREVLFLNMGGGDLIELFSPLKDGKYDLPDYDNTSLTIFHFALAVDDVDAATERCRDAGYAVRIEPKVLQLEGIHARLAFIIGPNGEHVEFFKNLSD